MLKFDMRKTTRTNATPEAPRSAVHGGEHQGIARIELILGALAKNPGQGSRLVDVCAATGLHKTAAHRLLNGLVDYRLVDFDADLSRYFVGFKIFAWASASGNRFGLARIAAPSLSRLAKRFEDAVYLVLRSGDEVVCIDRVEGAFPIKTLSFNIGDSRPLGIGAAGAAILAQLPDAEMQRILAGNRDARAAYERMSNADLQEILRDARQKGHAFVEGKIIPGMATVGAPIVLNNESPIAAISVSAIEARMGRTRRAEIAAAIKHEIDQITESFRA